ncbi:pyridoxamine 5'-phosphate oxidase family protein [Roseiarcaceae bacterium H3SJ34-1]|uniref:pyridoxamine 5'-phosphate oxidase family protein n=1 Tax=Terripilifer ovatus TaxID=3032367 RepID=UPI003AB97D78|nr:pyridoxamine 5'-phosphate oxidase family protein [Roseiarcaceae bacterium H3SJ34-1]
MSRAMSRQENARDDEDVSRLLAAAAKTIAHVRYCWLVTGAAHARPMGHVISDPDGWNIRFITGSRSRKAADIRGAGKVGLIFQHDPTEAYVSLTGAATLVERASEVNRLWKHAYDTYFPTETERANAAFIEVAAERMELWIRGVTPEPFGLQTTELVRDAEGSWRFGDRHSKGGKSNAYSG